MHGAPPRNLLLLAGLFPALAAVSCFLAIAAPGDPGPPGLPPERDGICPVEVGSPPEAPIRPILDRTADLEIPDAALLPSPALAPFGAGYDVGADSPAPSSGDRPYWRQNLFVRIWKDQKPLLLHWWGREFGQPGFTVPLVIGVELAGTSDTSIQGGLDVRMADNFDAWCSGSCNTIANDLTTLGNTPVAAAGLGITWLISRWTHNDRLSEATSLSAEALVDTGIYNEVLKAIFARTRPAGGSHGSFFNYGGAPEGQELGSFPSGHAQGAFTVAAVFAHVYDDRAWVAWVSYGTAALISAARVGLHRHFPSDVIVGGVLGDSIGRFVVERSRESARRRSASSALLHLHPFADPSQRLYGVSWDGDW